MALSTSGTSVLYFPAQLLRGTRGAVVRTGLGLPQGLLGVLASSQSGPPGLGSFPHQRPTEAWQLALEEVRAIKWEPPKLLAPFPGHECTHCLNLRFLHEPTKRRTLSLEQKNLHTHSHSTLWAFTSWLRSPSCLQAPDKELLLQLRQNGLVAEVKMLGFRSCFSTYVRWLCDNSLSLDFLIYEMGRSTGGSEFMWLF